MTLGEGRPIPLSRPPAEASAVESSGGNRGPRLLVRVLEIATLTALIAITIVPPGSTRVFLSPWSLVYGATLLGPVAILVLRAFDRQRPLVLPSFGWQLAGAATVGTLVLSALFSPYRPSALLWSAPLLAAVAVFYLVFDALQSAPVEDVPRRAISRWLRVFFGLVGLASLVEWLAGLRESSLAHLIEARNGYPLGHSNYTAGLALLMTAGFAAAAARTKGTPRALGILGTLLALAMLFSSGSRGGMLALLAMIAVGLIASPLRRATKWRIVIIGGLAALALMVANPRTRAMLAPEDPNAPPNISNVQRRAMLLAGWRMGADRPLLGWGPGTTPLAFPRYRAGLEGGAEDVLQLHCVPVQLWAELGLAGLVCAGAWFLLAARGSRRDLPAAVALAGYAVFALFDAQLDIPAFGFTVAALTALLAGRTEPSRPPGPPVVGVVALATGLILLAFGRADPTPEMNATALRIAALPAGKPRAIALLRASLARNPDQEIAHFNLGWLLVVDDPAEAARQFTAAAHLVPDKGGVYFGLGLARLNAGDSAGAAQAFALEAINDPIFLLSPWWRTPELQAVEPPTHTAIAAMTDRLVAQLPADRWTGRELRYVRTLAPWLDGTIGAEAVAAAANTDQRRAYFKAAPTPIALKNVGAQSLRRARIGYPVLMRNLDIAPPIDLWVVQESKVRETSLADLWPDKGWLPSPLLIALLDGHESHKN